MTAEPSLTLSLLARAEVAWAGGDGAAAMDLFEQAAQAGGSLVERAEALLGLARGQQYNLVPGQLPVRLHGVYLQVEAPVLRARLAAGLGRCWAYANEPRRARPFAIEALHLATQQDDPRLLADALDAALACHWGPDDLPQRRDWALLLGDVAAHLADLDARLQAELWSLTVAWETLDLPRIHRSMHAIELLAQESPRAEFFAASRRLPIELLRGRLDRSAALIERAAAAGRSAVIPDAFAVLHAMNAFVGFQAGDASACAAEAPAYQHYAEEFGVPTVRAEGAVVWIGAERLDKVAEMIGPFSADVLADLPRDSDWLLTLQCVLEGALAIADRSVVEAALRLLAPYPGRSVVNAGAVMWHGVTDDTLARGYVLLGDPAAAERHRSAALATYERIGATWWAERLRRALPVESRPDDEGPMVVHLHQQKRGLWLVGREGATFVLPRMRGLAHLHTLLSRPDAHFPALSLVGGEVVEQGELEVLDAESRRFLSSRLRALDAELAASHRREVQQERDAVAAYLARGTGLGGRVRVTGSNAERARVAVRKAIVAALARIAETDAWLARHLNDRVHTGFRCSYRSDPDHPVRWILRSKGPG